MKKILIHAVAATMLTSSLGAFAQGGPGPDERRDQDSPRQQQSQRSGQNHGASNRGDDNARSGNRAQQPDQRGPGQQAQSGPRNDRHPQQAQNRRSGEGRFQKGERLPSQYRGHQYVVDDWRGHGLKQPPRGHRWVQVGGEYVLVAIATGVIASIILNSR